MLEQLLLHRFRSPTMDATPTISVADLEPSINEGDTSITIPVTLSHPSTETVELTWGTFGRYSLNQ